MRRILPNCREEAGRPEGRERERAGREAGSNPKGGGEAEGAPQRRGDKTTREKRVTWDRVAKYETCRPKSVQYERE